MSSSGADLNLLFGILALQVDFIDRDQLISGMQEWSQDKTRSLSDILVDSGALRSEQRAPIEALLQAHMETNQNDVEKSLMAMTSAFSVPDELSKIEDGELEHTLSHVSSADSVSILTRSEPTDKESNFGRSSTDSGRFELVKMHEEGGLGTVWVARDKELDRKVAIKEIKERYADDGPSRRRFELEAEVTGGLEHPGVVPVYGYGNYSDGRPFYAMRFIRGESLRDAIREYHEKDWSREPHGGQTVALRRLLDRLLDVCNTIYYAHRRGILHRDIKPSNIMLGDYGETLVVDWGLAKTIGRSDEVTDSSLPSESTLMPRSGSSVAETMMGHAIGSPPYMSPEQARGEQDRLGPATDIYSLGATLYTILTNRRPVDGDSADEVLERVREGDWLRPRAIQADIPRPLESICVKAMALKPDDRYPSVRRMMRDIEQFLADEPVSAHHESTWELARRFSRRHRTLLVAGIGSLFLVSLISTMATVIVNSQRMEAQNLASRNRKLAASEQKARTAAETRATEAKVARERSDQVRMTLVEILRSPNPERDGRNVTVVEMLDNELARISESFDEDPLVRSELLRVIGETYLSLGQRKKALELARQAFDLASNAKQQDRDYRLSAHQFLAEATIRNGRFTEGKEVCLENYSQQARAYGNEDPRTMAALQVLAEMWLGNGDSSKAIEILKQVYQRMTEDTSADPRKTMQVAVSLATAYNVAERYDAAIGLATSARFRQISLFGEEDPIVLETNTVLATAYDFAGRVDEAINLHRETLEVKNRILGPTHVSTLESQLSLALAYIQAGKVDEATKQIAGLSKMAAGQRALLGSDNSLIQRIELLDRLAQLETLELLQGTRILRTLNSYYTTTDYIRRSLPELLVKSVPGGAGVKIVGALFGGSTPIGRLVADMMEESPAEKETTEQPPERTQTGGS